MLTQVNIVHKPKIATYRLNHTIICSSKVDSSKQKYTNLLVVRTVITIQLVL